MSLIQIAYDATAGGIKKTEAFEYKYNTKNQAFIKWKFMFFFLFKVEYHIYEVPTADRGQYFPSKRQFNFLLSNR